MALRNKQQGQAMASVAAESQRPTKPRPSNEKDPHYVPAFAALFAYVCYFVWVFYGQLHEHIFRRFYSPRQKEPPGYAPLLEEFTGFFTRYVYGRISDCLNRPLSSTPGAWVDVMERTGCDMFENIKFTGSVRKCLNLGSYNYLGFAESSDRCQKAVHDKLKQYGTSPCSARLSTGSTEVHRELESLVADFVGKEDCIVFGMGYATNSTNLPAIVGKGGLIVSDSLNHASIVIGTRCSEAKVVVFRHNDPKHLEQVLRQAIVRGQDRTRQPFTKILIVVEGIYSMEGEILKLPEIIAVKKKYKAYLYVDEAHSIGALGRRGRGVCDYWGVNPDDVDILMGTFTKSFGSTGGYIAGSRDTISYLRSTSWSWVHDSSMSVPAAQQVISSMRIIMGIDDPEEGQRRLESLRNNSNYFRTRLKELGYQVFGDEDSPIVPMMIYNLSKVAAFSRVCLENNIAVVVVGYPATPLLLSRARFCLSAAHTIPDLEKAIQTIDKLGQDCLLRYGQSVVNSTLALPNAVVKATGTQREAPGTSTSN
eukprot:TRINITY_DN7425_c0_g1_i2.p1 TRINITY_DN7425_c0_g1~~TRINITY_DN7425_c0_g1_i2.p1  ORF type:complete len:536 (+),score=105.45 TRINITY_DN7425_c0_g1_i2:85-1692(+)